MNIQMMPIGDVKPYHKNPRKNQKSIPEVAKYIQEFGFRQPIVVDENMVIVVGHTRHQAAISLGLLEVPVHIANDLTVAQIKAYRVADNRAGEHSEWDRDILLGEIDDMYALDTKYDADFLSFEVDLIDEPAEYKSYDTSEVHDEFVVTIRGPLTAQAHVMDALEQWQDDGEFKIEVSHLKRRGKK